ncbi:MAG: hypothetical protein OEL79_07825 [Chromatiales bacterium]|nr:hypothetical protein [Chromatiales bacterium]
MYKNGIRKASLLYNLGVCNYKLKNYKISKHWFNQVAQNRALAQIAHYNLGLIATKEDDRTVALRWLKLALKGGNEAIRSLASRQIEKNQPQNAPSRHQRFSMLNLSYGYDDNIIDPAATVASRRGDSYLSLFAMASQYLAGNLKDGWSIKGSIYKTDYFSVNAYDMFNIKGGISRSINLNEWPIKLSLTHGWTTLNNVDYLSKTSLTLKGKNNTLNSGTLGFRYRLNRINALNPLYDHLAGRQHQLKFENLWHGKHQNEIRLGYAFELNDRNNLYTGTTLTTSYSPTRHTFNLQGRERLNQHWMGKGGLIYRVSQYSADSNPQQRKDLTTTIEFSANRKIWGNWDFSSRVRHTENSSNITTKSYRRNELSLQLTRTF